MSTLVFVHGSGGTGAVFAAQTAEFPRSIVLTLPGHTTPGEATSIDAFADYVAAELDARDVRDAVLAGSSMGGAIALTLALRKHPRVRAIALLGSGAKLRVAPAIFEAIATDFAAAARQLAGYFFAEPREEWIEAAVTTMLAVGAKQTADDFHACDAFDVADRVGEIRIPVLALTGEKDVMTPPKFATFLADRIPGAQARIVAGAGHLLFVERPHETNDALAAFVSLIDSQS